MRKKTESESRCCPRILASVFECRQNTGGSVAGVQVWCARNGRSIMATGMSEMMDIALEPAAEGETATATSNPDTR